MIKLSALPFALLAAFSAQAQGYQTIESGVLDLCRSNTSSDYATYSTPLLIPADNPLTVYTSRYTEFSSNLQGSGDITFMTGGERTFIGSQKGDTYPDWSAFTGNVHVYPWTQVENKAGFYGIILNHGGKRFNPEDIAGSLPTTNSQLVGNKLYIHSGATLATPTGIRGVRLGSVYLEPGGRIIGAIKASSSNAAYIVIGCNGTDGDLAGLVAPIEKNGKPDPATLLGLIKEGDGVYTISGNDNFINGAVRVTAGKVMLCNDVDEARASHLGGAIGALGNNTPGMYVFKSGTVGGTGHSASVIDLYGTLAPGVDGIGTFTVSDFASSQPVNLRLRPASVIEFEIAGSGAADKLVVEGNLDFYNIGEDFIASDAMPVIKIALPDECDLQVGDSFTLVQAFGTSSLNDVPWHFDIKFPKRYTWQISESTDGSYSLTATVTSLDYSGQGDDSGDNYGDDNDDDDVFDADFNEAAQRKALRTYADAIGKEIGVAVSTWRYSIDSDNTISNTIGREFNTVVAENEMKFESLQPSRGNFTFNDGDRVVSFAERKGAAVRGHALVWHKQTSTWVSSDGGVKNNNNFTREELLDILEQHITTVVTHYKGKVKEWDVVNECLADDQSIIRTDPNGYTLRPSVWYSAIGEDYIDSAFVYAHRADPDAILILNDYGTEFKGAAKTEALYNLAKRLKLSGIPIDGVGLQCHLDVGEVSGSRLKATFDAYQEIGLTCRVTELDLGISEYTEEQLNRQANDYYTIARVCASHPNCPTLMIWGFADDHSWRESNPLLWSASHAKKPAYYGVHQAYRKQAEAGGIDSPEAEHGAVVSTRCYNLQGINVADGTKGIVVVVSTYADGSTTAKTVLNK